MTDKIDKELQAGLAAVLAAVRVLIAENHRAAQATAEIDWNWRRNAQGWIDHHGEQVRYAHSREGLMGLERGTTIYLGFNWFKNREWDRLNEIVAARDYNPTQPGEWSPNSIPAKKD